MVQSIVPHTTDKSASVGELTLSHDLAARKLDTGRKFDINDQILNPEPRSGRKFDLR
jgi:hypothetical protein